MASCRCSIVVGAWDMVGGDSGKAVLSIHFNCRMDVFAWQIAIG